MNRVKKTLIWILAGAAVIWAVLFAVEVVDKALHGADYAQSDGILDEINRINTESPSCSKKLANIRMEAFFYPPETSKIEKIVNDKKYLSEIEQECLLQEDSIKKLETKSNEFGTKETEIRKLFESYTKIYAAETKAVGILLECSAFTPQCKENLAQNTQLFTQAGEFVPELFYEARFRPTIKSLLFYFPNKLRMKLERAFYRNI